MNYDLIFIGHEHEAFSIDNKLFCLGSSGCRKDNMTKYTILDTNTFNIETKYIEFDWNKFLDDLNEEDYSCRSMIAEHFYGIKM